MACDFIVTCIKRVTIVLLIEFVWKSSILSRTRITSRKNRIYARMKIFRYVIERWSFMLLIFLTAPAVSYICSLFAHDYFPQIFAIRRSVEFKLQIYLGIRGWRKHRKYILYKYNQNHLFIRQIIDLIFWRFVERQITILPAEWSFIIQMNANCFLRFV